MVGDLIRPNPVGGDAGDVLRLILIELIGIHDPQAIGAGDGDLEGRNVKRIAGEKSVSSVERFAHFLAEGLK